MAADHDYFSNLIWQIADLLRGPYFKERRSALIAAAVTGQIDVTRELGPGGAH